MQYEDDTSVADKITIGYGQIRFTSEETNIYTDAVLLLNVMPDKH